MYKQAEAWININKINDVISTTVKMHNKATVAVLQGNAAAGGAMFALACDVTVAHPVMEKNLCYLSFLRCLP
jgi:enoyl-CoA hydratase/carnithine racemase